MAILRAYATTGVAPVVGPAYEHTYVTSDDGYLWGCLGSYSGGWLLGSGTGSSAVAECVSHPRSAGSPPLYIPTYAGLRYARDGVCHQMANRILRIASPDIKVSGARLYGISFRLYGAYGSGFWPEWSTCLSSAAGASASPPDGEDDGSDGSGAMAQTQMKQRLDALYEKFEAESGELGPDYGDPRLRRAEFNIMIDETLGPDYDPEKRSHLLEIEASLRARKSYLDAALDSGSMDFEKYLARLSEMMADIARAYEAVLGRGDYLRLFGSEPEEASAVIDPSVRSARPEDE